jgi:hypothetical protein
MKGNWNTSQYNLLLNVEDPITDTTYYPASGSFIDVSGYERFVFQIMAGGLDTETTFAVRQDTSATVTGSVKIVTGATVVVAALGDDKLYTIEVSSDQLDLANGFHYVSLYSTGAAGGNDYAAISFHGLNPRNEPVTQPATTPAAGQILVTA